MTLNENKEKYFLLTVPEDALVNDDKRKIDAKATSKSKCQEFDEKYGHLVARFILFLLIAGFATYIGWVGYSWGSGDGYMEGYDHYDDLVFEQLNEIGHLRFQYNQLVAKFRVLRNLLGENVDNEALAKIFEAQIEAGLEGPNSSDNSGHKLITTSVY